MQKNSSANKTSLGIINNKLAMVIYNSIFLIQFMILKIVSTDIPNIVTFNVELSENENVEVNLVPFESFLANENVPVWITSTQSSLRLVRVNNVMQKVGPLSFYRDPKMCAAAVYFHNRESFYGIVGYHHVIDNLVYDSKTNSVVQSDYTVFPSSLKRHDIILPDDEIIPELAGSKPRTWHESLLPFPHTVYIEMLVIVNYDISQKLKDYTKIATFVVNFGNNVDMMFSKIKKPKIKFNIAGIIIVKERGSFLMSTSESCYRRSNNEENQLDADCLLDFMSLILHDHQDVPSRSYDIAILLTGFTLVRNVTRTPETEEEQEIHEVRGLALMPNPAYNYGLDIDDILVGVVSSYSDDILPLAAHEIAHMLGAGHDGGPLFGSDRKCAAHLMRQSNYYCKRCFRFAGRTLREFRTFFRSRQACIFHNKPRSLYPSHLEVFWTEEEQCKCYGFPSALSKWSYSMSLKFSYCESVLQCKGNDHKEHRTGIFMDGTPCDSRRIGSKVCWNNKCLSIS